MYKVNFNTKSLDKLIQFNNQSLEIIDFIDEENILTFDFVNLKYYTLNINNNNLQLIEFDRPYVRINNLYLDTDNTKYAATNRGVFKLDKTNTIVKEEISNDNYVYPNPSDEYIYLPSANLNQLVEIYNSLGLLIKIERVNSNTSINIKNLAIGIYFVKFDNHLFKFEIIR